MPPAKPKKEPFKPTDGKTIAAKRTPKTPKARRTARRTKLKTDAIETIFSTFHAAEPEPKGELEHVNPFTLVIAVLLSAQATDAGVNKATRALFAIADTPEKMLALGEDKVRDYVKTIGLYRNKAKNVILLCEKLIKEHDGEVPADRDALEQLPGVGRKTANVVMNMAFGEPTMAVDTHVFRVSNRMGLSSGKDPLQVEEDLVRIIPPAYGLHAHHWLILHGRYLCKARSPECWRCPVAELCLFKDKTPAPDSSEAKALKAAARAKTKKAAAKKAAAKKPLTARKPKVTNAAAGKTKQTKQA
ncbi:MAG: endonuclease III [Pseudomonadota bacterium]